MKLYDLVRTVLDKENDGKNQTMNQMTTIRMNFLFDFDMTTR